MDHPMRARPRQRLLPGMVNGESGGALAALANGDRNRLLVEDRAAHDWYRFVLSFPPQLVREFIERFGLGPGHTVLDPFCGTGTTLVECKKSGVASIGFEAHPMSALASEAKTTWDLPAAQVLDYAHEVAERTSRDIGEINGPLRTLPPDALRLLIKGSISPLPLHKTLVLLQNADELADSPHVQRLGRLALARSLVTDVGNLHFGPEVGTGAFKDDAPVVESWLGNMECIAADLEALRECAGTPTRVECLDSRDANASAAAGDVDAVIASPPYPNEKDYTRTTRLETVVLGLIRDGRDLRRLKQRLLRSNTRNVYKADADDRWGAEFPEVERLARQIEDRRVALGKTSGFERMYHRVAKLYFGGMAMHLAALRAMLRPGARLAYVVGDQASYLRVLIRTGELLGVIAGRLGYRVDGLELFRTRRATATRGQLREEVLLMTWPG